jgi:hypothetical protein
MNQLRVALFTIAFAGSAALAATALAQPRGSFASDQRLLSQSLNDLRAAKSKLHRVERDYGSNRDNAERSVESAINAVEAAIDHARNNPPEPPPRHGHDHDR